MESEEVEEYKSSLNDLTMNSKPLISALTMLAEDYVDHAASIVDVIETRIRKVEEKTRQSLFKLRQTWNALFPSLLLHALDVEVKKIDPAWPVTATPPPKESASPSIHVNPKFLKQENDAKSAQQLKEQELARQNEVARQLELKRQAEKQRKVEEALREQKAREMELEILRQQEELRKREEERRRKEQEEADRLRRDAEARIFEKQQELMKLQQQRLQLELEEAKAKLEMQRRQLEQQNNVKPKEKIPPLPTNVPKAMPQPVASSRKSPPKDPRSRRSEPMPTSSQTAVVHPTKSEKPESPRPERHMARRGGISAHSPSRGREATRPKKLSPPVESSRGRKTASRRHYRRRSDSDDEAKFVREDRRPRREPSPTPPKKKKRLSQEKEIKSAPKRSTPPVKEEKMERPPPKKVKHVEPTETGQSGSLPDDLAELFGKEDTDYRRLPPIPKLNTKATPPPDGLLLQSPRSASWDRFKADRPSEYPKDSFRSPLQSPPKPLDIPKALQLEKAEDIILHAEEQLKSGKLSEEKYHEVLKQVAELFRIQKQRRAEQTSRIADPRTNRPPQNRDEDLRQKPHPSRSSRPEPWLQPVQDIPDFDREMFYVPEYDPRWSSRVQEMQGNLANSHSLILNNTSYDLKPDSYRKIKVAGQEVFAKIVSQTKEVLLKLRSGGTAECYYILGEPARAISLFGQEFRIFVLGPLKRLWIDMHQFEVKADSPPLTIWLANERHSLRICSFTRRIFVDGHDICPFDTAEAQKVRIAYKDHEISFKPPPREIKIDGHLRRLDLGAAFPLVLMDNNAPHGIRFDGDPRVIKVDGQEVPVDFHHPVWHSFGGGRRRRLLAFGGPGHEVIIDNQWFEVKFGGPEKSIQVGLNTVCVQLEGPPPGVKILGELISENRAREMAGWPPTREINWHHTISGSSNFTGPQMWGATPQQPVAAPHRPPFNGPMRPMRPLAPPLMAPPPIPNISPVGQQHPMPAPAQQQQPMPPPPPPPSSINTQVDVNDLYGKLLNLGIIRKKEPEKKEADKPAKDLANNKEIKKEIKTDKSKEVKEEVIDMTEFDIEKLKKRQDSIIEDLYSGFQCSSCGQRFTPGETEQYRDHLDWHFRQNKKEKEVSKVTKYRFWYFSYLDWLKYEEITSKEDREHSELFDKMASTDVPNPTTSTPLLLPGDRTSCPVASGDDDDDKCNICRESFEQFWAEDQEEWHLKDAVRVEGRTYHPLCFQDLKANEKPEAEDELEETTPDPIKDPVGYIQSLTKKAKSKSPTAIEVKPHISPKPQLSPSLAPRPPTPSDTKPISPIEIKPRPITPVEVKSEAASQSPHRLTPNQLSPRASQQSPQPGLPVKVKISPQPIVIQPILESSEVTTASSDLKDPGTPVLDEPERKLSIDEPGTPLQDEPTI